MYFNLMKKYYYISSIILILLLSFSIIRNDCIIDSIFILVLSSIIFIPLMFITFHKTFNIFIPRRVIDIIGLDILSLTLFIYSLLPFSYHELASMALCSVVSVRCIEMYFCKKHNIKGRQS
jgi:hypothetical protein